MPISAIQTLLEQRLAAALSPLAMAVEDDSAKHAGHAGAQGGAAHFSVRIVSNAFSGKSRVARHRLVYHALSDLMPERIHALAIEALTPDEIDNFPLTKS
jgi:BolA family transcriptional regulator, general stress-responsive regulator